MSEPLKCLDVLRRGRWVDLTHSFHPGIPHCPSFSPEQRTVLYDHEPRPGILGSGFLAHEYRHVGQWGTHVDPPAHFAPGLRFQDEIPVTEMILPLVVLDVHEQVEADADYCVTAADLAAWEDRNGPVPKGSFVALRTDWSHRWPSQDHMLNAGDEGVYHYPGWSLEVLTTLIEQREVTACGHETLDTDPGIVVSKGQAPLERYVLERNRYQIELLTALDHVPGFGAVIVASWPKAKNGSGFPARVFAICP
ncbi:cyclase family protein [Streptosporangium sp. NPDC000396]|uniref:cyclase family protein n=1 Tax=Streptosporangium sp. NPDC000396 TaxID=3366185 RepID=UPI0036C83301